MGVEKGINMVLNCPVCHGASMEVIDFHGEEVDFCPGCRSLWFENGELDAALSTADNGDDSVAVEGALGRRLGKAKVHCMHCQKAMDRYHLMEEYQIELDVCHQCRGILVEGDEVDKVVRSPELKQHLAAMNGQLGVKTWVFQFFARLPIEFNLRPRSTPVVMHLILLINVALFLSYYNNPQLEATLIQSLALQAKQALAMNEPWTWLSHMFLHGDWLHLIGNMYFLYILGDNLEDVLGHGRFLACYLVCGLSAALLESVIDPNSMAFMLGASGAVAGMFGMYLMWFRNASLSYMFLVYQRKLSPLFFFALWLGLNVLGVILQLQGVAYWAHIGGFIVGLSIGYFARGWVMQRNPLLAMLNQPEVVVTR